MSTSDAEQRRGDVGGETRAETQRQSSTPGAREQDKTPAHRFEHLSVRRPPLTRQNSIAHRLSLNFPEDRTDLTNRPRFTSHFSLKLGSKSLSNLHIENTSSDSFHGPSPSIDKKIFYRVHDLAVHTVDWTETSNTEQFSNGLHRLRTEDISQSEIPAQRANSLDLNVEKRRAKELSGDSAMLSTTVVTVLAPQWSGRMRRSKREGTGASDFQGNLSSHNNSSSSVERMLTSGLQSQQNASFARSNTVGWSTRSGPTSLDNERKMHQSASLDMRLDDKRTDRPIPSPLSSLSPLSPLSPVSPMAVDTNEPQRSPQRGHSPLSSKPTTSSMLLSLRRVNSPLSPTENQTQSPDNFDNNRQFSAHLSQSFQHKNQLSPNSISNNANAPLSSSPTQRDRLANSYNYSTVPSKHAESPYSQANASQEDKSPQRSFSRDLPDSIKLTKKPLTLPKRTPYDHTALLKSHSNPRRPLLSDVTWMPQDSTQSSSQITSNTQTNTHVTAPFNSNNMHSDNTGVNGKMSNYRGNKSITEVGGNLLKLQGGQANTQNSSNHPSVQVKADSFPNRDAPKPISLPGTLSNTKFSIAATHTAVSQAKPTNHDASSGLFTAKATEFTPTPLLSPKSPYTPTDNSSKYQNMYSTSKMNASMQPNKDKLTKQSHLNDITNAVTNANYKSSFDLGQSNKASFQSTSSNVSSPKEDSVSSKFTPLGFERCYFPKPYQPKTNLSPTISLYTKSNYSPSSPSNPAPASSPSYLSPRSPPVTVSSLLTPPSTPIYQSPSSPQTPSPKANRSFSGSVDLDPKKQNSKGEKKVVKRVTFDESADTNAEEKQESLNQLSPRNVKAPSIFNVLRSGNQPNTFSPTPKSSSIQVGAGTKYRSLSSDSAELKSREMYKQMSTDSIDHKKHGLNLPRQERTQSAESATQYRSTPALSLPPDFSNGYKNRYSSPPYSTLVSSRTPQTETKTKPPRSPLFQRHSQPDIPNAAHISTPVVVKNPLLTSGSLSLRPVQIDLKEKGLSLDQVNNNLIKPVIEGLPNGQIQLVDNRVHVSSQSLPGDKSPRVSSCVTETLVYSIRGRLDRSIDVPKSATPKSTANMPVTRETQLSQQVQRKEVLKEQDNMANLSTGGSVESQNIDDDSSKRKIKEVGKSKFYSIENNNEQSPKRSRFALKKNSSTANTSLARSDSEKTSKVDQMISKIRQTFSTRKPSNEEECLAKKWRRASLGGVSDSSTSDVTVESNKMVEEEEVTMELNNNEKGVEDMHRWANNKYTIVQTPPEKNKMVYDKFSMWTDEVMSDAEEMPEKRSSPLLKTHSPTQGHSPKQEHVAFDFKPSNFLSPNGSNSGFSSNSGLRKSSSSPKPPMSPFPSLSPSLSPFSSTDKLDDSVFYSPKPPRKRDSSSSPCELGEISLVASRRSRASTGPPSAEPVPNKERMSSSYADLKYGIEPGRSFSVSSVSSSRPSGPGRISTGSKFMSVGDLTKATTFSCGHTVNDSTGLYGCETNSQSGQFPNDGKVRSRSLPRSFTQLSSWSAGQLSTSSNPTWAQCMDTVDIPWATEGPPTPPPTPPLSPRRMSKPPSSPSFSGRSESPQDTSPRGHLPSRGYMSSLSTFEESSDSSSDTTTDDEYYLDTGDDEEKETEL